MANAAAPPVPSSASSTARDLRLDFFRGLALAFIFLNHIPNNVASWLSHRNYGFSDATEIFIFLSGYSACLVYARVMQERGFLVAAARILGRCWQIYTAHIFLFVIFVAHIAYMAERFSNPTYFEEMNLARFLVEPHVLVLQALLLKFKPVNMDVLPVYVVLLAAFPLILAALRRAPHAVLAASLALYLAANATGLNLPAYPRGVWFFNPLTWQFLFVLGAWCALPGHAAWIARLPRRTTLAASLLFLLLALAEAATWQWPAVNWVVPDAVERVLLPISKTDLDWPRILHFLALAYACVRLLPREARAWGSRWIAPLVWMGQQSLHIFCAGIVLSFVAHVALVEVSGTMLAQALASAAGLAVLVALAAALNWFKQSERSQRPAAGPGRPSPITGGE
ncbi:MAG: OpgC domain-containing protein [Alphaproteobacteria bacterium]|nr:OpgC domain-containing protein [Alphaproteobacteria bacterium]